MRLAAYPLALGLVLGGCAIRSDAEPTDSADSGVIIGTNDFVSVLEDGANIPEKYRPLVDAFGRMGGCTATHIGNGLAISAGHCFRAGSEPQTNMPCSRSVAWGYRKDKPAYLTSKCEVVLAAQNGARDYAIFVVRPIPPVSVAVSTTRPLDGSEITIFGHPRRRPLEWSRTCTVKASTNPASSFFRHQCDTEPASSGSSILDDTSLAVIGIHDGGGGQANYATYFADTPIQDFLSGYNVPPRVTFTAPAAAAEVREIITVSIEATDVEDGPVNGVTFKLPDGTTTEVKAAPYEVRFDTRLVADGEHTISATAKDSTRASTTTNRKIIVANASAPPTAPTEDPESE
jgi:hypothetical protein